MMDTRYNGLVLGLIVLVALVAPAAAFGAGNIGSTSKVEGQNCTRRAPLSPLSLSQVIFFL